MVKLTITILVFIFLATAPTRGLNSNQNGGATPPATTNTFANLPLQLFEPSPAREADPQDASQTLAVGDFDGPLFSFLQLLGVETYQTDLFKSVSDTDRVFRPLVNDFHKSFAPASIHHMVAFLSPYTHTPTTYHHFLTILREAKRLLKPGGDLFAIPLPKTNLEFQSFRTAAYNIKGLELRKPITLGDSYAEITRSPNDDPANDQLDLDPEKTPYLFEQIWLHGALPTRAVDPKNLAGSRVLDVGTGYGQFVLDLRTLDIEAYGIDITHYTQWGDCPYLLQMDAAHTTFSAESFDSIFSFYGPLSSEIPPGTLPIMLLEMKRILKIGGHLWITIVAPKYAARLHEALATISDLEVHEIPLKEDRSYFEIIKLARVF